MEHDPDPDGIFALRFSDGLRAATFALTLRKTLIGARGRPAAPAAARVWMDHPLEHLGDQVCCVYVNAVALDAARQAGLTCPEPMAVNDPQFPNGRLPVVDALAAERPPDASGDRPAPPAP